MKLNNMPGQPCECNNKQEPQKVRVEVDFKLVWGIMWRWIILIFALYIIAIVLAGIMIGISSLIN